MDVLPFLVTNEKNGKIELSTRNFLLTNLIDNLHSH